jgi:hypothetical protein
MTVIGYARVSTTDQDLSIQEAVLRAAGCDVIRAEKQRGTSTQGRAELRTVLDFIGKGDMLLVTRVDRLARSIADLQDIVRTLKAKGAILKATEQPSTPARPPASASSTCSVCSPSSRPTSDANASLRASPRRKPPASTEGDGLQSIRPRWRNSRPTDSALPRLRSGSRSAVPRSIASWLPKSE